MAEYRMPSLGADMEAGTLLEWSVKPGDEVHKGQVVGVVDTQKGAIDMEIFQEGVVEKILVEPGQKVPVGTVLALVREEGQSSAAGVPEAPPAGGTPPAPEASPPVAGIPPGPTPPAGTRQRISPLARRRAAELGLDPAAVTGSGPGEAVTLEDVERAARPGAPQSREDKRTAMRRAIAAAMARSKRDIPHYYLKTAIDMSRAVAWLTAENERRPVTERLLPVVLPLKAVALALEKVPELNGYWREDGFEPADKVHLGVAVSLRGGGLVAPALHDAAEKSLDQLMVELRDLVQRARSDALRSSEMTDATLTVTNLGDQGVDTVYGVIYPPQVALVGLGRIGERPWAVEGRVEVRPVLEATLAADHRASDGHRGGLFLARLARLLQQPEKL